MELVDRLRSILQEFKHLIRPRVASSYNRRAALVGMITKVVASAGQKQGYNLMKRVFWLSTAMTALAAAWQPGPALATLTAPDASYGASLGKYANFTSVSYSGIGTFSDGFSSVTVGAQPSPFIQSHAYGVAANGNPSVAGNITYYVGIDGPADGTFVPINVAYAMSGKIALVGAAYDGFAQANLTLLSYYKGNPLSLVFLSQSGNFNVSGSTGWEVASGTTGQVSLYTHSGLVVGYYNQEAFGGTAEAFIDPVFTIDPAFSATHPGYSLVFSQGVGNGFAGAVPDPASWLLMLGGFGIVGSALRRSRQNGTVRATCAPTSCGVIVQHEEPVPLFQQLTGSDPARRYDVRQIPAVASERRGSAGGTWDRSLPRDGAVLVEPLRADVRR